MDIYGDNPSVRISWCHLLLVLWNLFVTYLVAFLKIFHVGHCVDYLVLESNKIKLSCLLR